MIIQQGQTIFGGSYLEFGLTMLKGLKLLVADDSEQTLEMMQFILQSEGASVCTAVNGLEAVQASQQEAFDVILMDIQMPVCGGIEATQKIRDLGLNTPVIAVTAAPETEAEELLSQGFDDYYLKPVDFSNLIQKVLGHVKAVISA